MLPKLGQCNQTQTEIQIQEQAEKEAKLGNATALGGSIRLRGYPQGRFFDSYTNFQGIEFRVLESFGKI